MLALREVAFIEDHADQIVSNPRHHLSLRNMQRFVGADKASNKKSKGKSSSSINSSSSNSIMSSNAGATVAGSGSSRGSGVDDSSGAFTATPPASASAEHEAMAAYEFFAGARTFRDECDAEEARGLWTAHCPRASD